MRFTIFLLLLLTAIRLTAQQDNWIAPEGRILNYRTLNWNDFQDREDKALHDKLAEQNLLARAYICPAIYFYADSGQHKDNGRVSFKFRVKCAFQTKSFAREATKKEHSNYVLIHEQDHYDIALNYANILQRELSARDYSADHYNDELDKVAGDLLKKYYNTQEAYDHEVNPDGTEEKEKQYLWDMRIKKCLENVTDEYYQSPENVVVNVRGYGQSVKRIPGEAALQFVVRARPMYTEFSQDMAAKVVVTSEWTPEPSIIAFYSQKYYIQEDGNLPRDTYRTLAFMFVPNGKDTYKRIVIDTFVNDGRPVSIATTLFANADSDNVKELVILATSPQRDKDATGTLYMCRVYDNLGRLLPAKLKRLEEPTARLLSGFEGDKAGKPSKAKIKSQKDILDVLKQMGYGG